MLPTEDAVICGKTPLVVVSRMTGVLADRSFEVPAAMLVNAACALVGVVNFVTMKVMAVPAENVPAVSFTINTGPPTTAAVQDPDAGMITTQTLGELLVSNAIPAPDSVMAMPALAPEVMA